MAGFFVILGPLLGVVARIGEYLMTPMKEQLNYLCCYKGNTEKLRIEVEKQDIVRNTVQQAVDTAKRNVESIRPDVDDWLRRANKIKEMSDKILNDTAEAQRGCRSGWFTMSYYSLSKEAKKTAEVCIELQLTGKMFERVSNPGRAVDLKMVPSVSQIRFKSRECIEKELMDALMDESIYVIGVCGMGGVGKTTMVENILNRAREKMENSSSMFEEIVIAVVTQQPDLPKIQQELAEGLGLQLEEKTLGIRARLLHARLMEAKSVLIILDDVWERLNLEELGVPSHSTHSGCKLILTSRVRNALTLTKDAKILSLEVLTDEESWILFREKGGDSFDAPDLYQIAKDVAKECKGLPLALVTVGSALRDLGKPSWEDALLGLKRSIPTNIPEVLKDVYRPLELSYNQLGNEEAYFFLLCCLFPEGCNISLETLVRYGLGLDIFVGIENLREARNRARKIVENLKNRFLLINSDKDGKESVKMHDVIRDMAVSIASKDDYIFMISHNKDLEEWPRKYSSQIYTCISLRVNKLKFLPERMNFPRLEVLHMEFAEEKQQISENFFDGMRRLKVLDAWGIQSVVSSVCLLTNLRVLQLHNCFDLELPSTIGELVTLEILTLVDSDIKVLPKEIGKLKNLKLLEAKGCRALDKIAPGVISRLVRLEELHLIGSFKNWEVEKEGKERCNATLAEVASLSNLTTLKIEILDPKLTLLELPHWQKLRQYFVVIGNIVFDSYKENFQKVMWFKHDELTPLGDWTYGMLRNAEYLKLEGNGSHDLLNKLAQRGFLNVKDLKLSMCHNVEYLVPSHLFQRNGIIFPLVESLHLENCQHLKELFQDPPPPRSFGGLKRLKLRKLPGLMRLWMLPRAKLCLINLISVNVTDCQSLQYLFSPSMAESMRQLEKLKIMNCPVMEEVFKEEGREVETTISEIKFPKLYELWLGQLPRLIGFCKAIDAIEFPALYMLRIEHLPRITNFCPTTSILSQEGNSSVGEQFLFNQEVMWPRLRKLYLYKQNSETGIFKQRIPIGNFSGLEFLRIESCHQLRSLFSPLSYRGLLNLNLLRVKDCSMLEEVIEKDDKDQKTNVNGIVFPRLRKLELLELPRIQAFCYSNTDLEFPTLELVKIISCPVMKAFSSGSLSVPNITLDSNLANQPFFSKELVCTSLEKLKLQGLNSTTGIFCNGISIGKFSGLEILEVESCHALRSLFSPSMFGVLVNLKKMTVIDCSMLQEVISEEVKEGQIEMKGTLFSQLKELVLLKLPEIRSFCFTNHNIELPSLEQVTIEDCPLMETFSSGSPNWRTSGPKLASQPFFSEEVSCISLKRLKLNKLNPRAEIFGYRIPIGNFSELEVLEIMSCNRLRSIFSPPMFRGVINLKMLEVKDCSMLQEVITMEDKEEKTILFPLLKKLKLTRLPKILRFCHMRGYLELPSLELLHIRDCPLMKTFSVPNLSATMETSDSSLSIAPFFSKQVMCSSLKQLRLQKLSSTETIFGHGIPIGNFCGLECLEVGSCQNLRSLLSSPMFRGLNNLKELKVMDCPMLPEVFSQDCEEEGQTSKIEETLFPQLHELMLVRLPKMHRFGHMTNYLDFPSLKVKIIKHCPKLE